MSQKALDLRRSVQIVRHHRILMAAAVGLGVLAGGTYAVLNPPMLTSTALIAITPPASQSNSQQQAVPAGGTDPYTATQQVVAGSDRGLLAAQRSIHPAASLDQLRRLVKTGSPATDIVSVTASGKTAAIAEGTANAVASSYIVYVTPLNSPAGHVSAHL